VLWDKPDDKTKDYSRDNVRCWIMRRRSKKGGRRSENSAPTMDESAGQQLSPEEQERATLNRIMSEMGHHRGPRGGKGRPKHAAEPHHGSGQKKRRPNPPQKRPL
jgi:hypothetical protein